MIRIHGIKLSFNTAKVVYVAEAVGAEYEYADLDLMKGSAAKTVGRPNVGAPRRRNRSHRD